MKYIRFFLKILKTGFFRALFRIAAILFLAILFVFITLQFPAVQTKLAQNTALALSRETGFKIELDYLNVNWLDVITLENLVVRDLDDTVMLHAKELTIDLDITDLIGGQRKKIDEVELNQAKLSLVTTPEDSLNFDIFIQRLKNTFSRKGGKKDPSPFQIKDIYMWNINLVMNHLGKDSIHDGFDYHHFNLRDLQLEAENFYALSDSIKLDIKNLSTQDIEGRLILRKMQSRFSISDRVMAFQNLELEVGNSIIHDSILFKFSGKEDLNHFNDSVVIDANLEQTIIYSRDLAQFAPGLKKYNEFYLISGDVNGKVKQFDVRNLRFEFGENSVLYGNISLNGLPNFSETLIQMSVRNSKIDVRDLKQRLSKSYFEQIENLETVNFNGNFVGFPEDFVANAHFVTKYGQVYSDINLKLSQDPANIAYRGVLSLYNFDLGKLLNRSDLFQGITMSGTIKGSGLDLKNADFVLKADFQKLGFKNYAYQNISTNAHLTKGLFDGVLSVNDPLLKFRTEAFIDIRDNSESIKLNMKLDTAAFKSLNLTNKDISMSSEISIDTRGLVLDSIVGDAQFKNTRLRVENRGLFVKSILVESEKQEKQRYFKWDSDQMLVKFTGHFDFTVVWKDIKRMIQEYKVNLLQNEEEVQDYYAKNRDNVFTSYDIDYFVQLNDALPFLRLWMPGLYIAESALLEGSFSHGEKASFSLLSHIDSIGWNDYLFIDNEIDFSTTKTIRQPDVLAMLSLNSERQIIGGLTKLDNAKFEAVWSNKSINFTARLEQYSTNNLTEIFGIVEFLQEYKQLKLNATNFRILNKVWEFSPENLVRWNKRELEIQNFELTHGEQVVRLNGKVSEDSSEVLNLDILKLNLENINAVSKRSYSGRLTGNVSLSNAYGDPLIESKLIAKEFKIEEFLVGDIDEVSFWDPQTEQLNIKMEVNREEDKIVRVAGSFRPKKQDQLQLIANFQDANLNIAEPFINKIFSNVGGTASGKINISGTLQHPILRGQGSIQNGKIRVNYLNTSYTFVGPIHFDENEIGVRNLQLRDERDNLSTMNGGIFHDGFKNFVLDISADLDNFQVLNTTSKDNSLYYGSAYVTGDLNFLGPTKNLDISANATTNKDTKIYIPIGRSSGIEKEEYINFVSFRDTIKIKPEIEEEDVLDLRGLNLNFDLEVTPDAYTEIIFDLKAGDIIRGRGNGKITLLIDTRGEFNMFGDYEMVEGGYNFTLYNIINKEFDIQPKSKITWFGDPYQGILDLTAVYHQMASMAPLVSDSLASRRPVMRRRYPTEVVLDLEGSLLNPDISFDIQVEELPDALILDSNGNYRELRTIYQAFKNELNTNEQELNRQVFSLIVLRKFSPLNEFSAATGQTFGNSVSELISNQLSYLATQVDENLEINIDLASLDQDAFNTFQLRLSYTFLDGRLRITRDGGFTNIYEQTDASSIAGDWILEYLLTPDGKFKIKMYSKNNFDNLAPGIELGSSNMAGFSFIYSKSFDKLKELLINARKRGLEKRKEEVPEEPIPSEEVEKIQTSLE